MPGGGGKSFINRSSGGGGVCEAPARQQIRAMDGVDGKREDGERRKGRYHAIPHHVAKPMAPKDLEEDSFLGGQLPWGVKWNAIKPIPLLLRIFFCYFMQYCYLVIICNYKLQLF